MLEKTISGISIDGEGKAGTLILAYTLGALIIAMTVSEVESFSSSLARTSAVSSSYQNCDSYN